MAYIEPNTSIYFLSGIPFDPTYENTMVFDSAQAQYDYMISHLVRGFEDNSYQRKDKGVLKVGYSIDGGSNTVISLLYNANYMMFKNTNFENKWFYAFVTRVEYINNNTVEVYYSIDVIQTWMFDFHFNDCLIEREHTTTDIPGNNLIPESLETGDYMFSPAEKVAFTPGIVVAINTRIVDGEPVPVPGKLYYGRPEASPIASGAYYSGVEFLGVRCDDAEGIALLNQWLEQLVEANLKDSIMGIMMMPLEFFSTDGSSKQELTKTYATPASVGSYIPRNKKLLTWPYNGLYVSTMSGNAKIFPYEYFNKDSNGRVTLVFWGNTSMNPGLLMYPAGYKTPGLSPNYDEVMSVSGFPPCCYSIDAYKAWWAQNAGTLFASSVGIMSQFAVDTVMLAPPGIGSDAPQLPGRVTPQYGLDINVSKGGIIGALGMLGQIFDHATLPAQTKGNTNGNLMFQGGLLTFLVGTKYIRYEFASLIDSFFDMYGYASHRVGKPNLKARPCYSYVKTVGASIDGDVPTDDIVRIEQIFDKGVRFWRTTATFGSFDPNVNDNRV